jgi:hypothetical protein
MTHLKVLTCLVAVLMVRFSVDAYGVEFTSFECEPISQAQGTSPSIQVRCKIGVARPGQAGWLTAVGVDCRSFCAARQTVNVPSPDGFSCTSGEARPWSAIGVVNYARTGCWHNCAYPEGSPGAVSVGGLCYSPGQKRDNDTTDITVGCYCARGDIHSTLIDVGVHASGTAQVSALSHSISGWSSAPIQRINDLPGRVAYVRGTVPLSGQASLLVTLQAQGACGTSIEVSARTNGSGGSSADSPPVRVSLPACSAACSDGIDNDQDGATDHPQDLGCEGAADPDESAPALTGIKPIAECVEKLPNGMLIAHFGYDNSNREELVVPVGKGNHFLPGGTDRGQPKKFKKGRITRDFKVELPATEKLTWVLGGSSVEVTSETPQCACSKPQCVETRNVKILSKLDGIARTQRDALLELTQIILNQSPPSSTERKAREYRNAARAAYAELLKDLWTDFPRVSKACPECGNLDLSGEIDEIAGRSQRILRVSRQAAELIKIACPGNGGARQQELLRLAEDLFDQFKKSSKELPRFTASCG